MSTYRWHHNVSVDGKVYPLRNRLDPAYGSIDLSDHAFGLSPAEGRTQTAVHELGHALVWLHQGGVRVRKVRLGPHLHTVSHRHVSGCTAKAPVHDTSRMLDWALGVAAGERAVDRWLREEGLWTPSRAAWAELTAKHDRDLILGTAALDPRPAFGTAPGGGDYADLHELADQALVQVWDRLRDAVPVLLSRESISGDELGSLVGTANRRHA